MGVSGRGAGLPLPSAGGTTIHCTSCNTRAVTICTLSPLDSLRGEREGEGEGGRGRGRGKREGEEVAYCGLSREHVLRGLLEAAQVPLCGRQSG